MLRHIPRQCLRIHEFPIVYCVLFSATILRTVVHIDSFHSCARFYVIVPSRLDRSGFFVFGSSSRYLANRWPEPNHLWIWHGIFLAECVVGAIKNNNICMRMMECMAFVSAPNDNIVRCQVLVWFIRFISDSQFELAECAKWFRCVCVWVCLGSLAFWDWRREANMRINIPDRAHISHIVQCSIFACTRLERKTIRELICAIVPSANAVAGCIPRSECDVRFQTSQPFSVRKKFSKNSQSLGRSVAQWITTHVAWWK